MRIEPPVSEPIDRSKTPAATRAAEPPDEPPEVRDGSRGVRVSPISGGAKPAAYSRHWVVAKTSAPAARSRATRVASRSAGAGSLAGLPQPAGTPATETMSLIATRRPAIAPVPGQARAG